MNAVRARWILAFVLLASFAWSCSPVHAARAERARKLTPSKPFEATLDLASSSFAEFYVEVPQDSVVLRWKLVTRRVELDLGTRIGSPVEDGAEGADFTRSSDGGEAAIVYDRFSDPAVRAERAFARVDWPYKYRPRTVGERLERVTFTIEASVVASRIDGVLASGTPLHGTLDAQCGAFRSYTIEVPKETRALRFDIADATSDLDLYARHAHPFLVLDDSVHFAQHSFGRETLVIRNADGSAIDPGTWYVDVVDTYADDRAAQFTLHARFDASPPPELLAFPALAGSIGPGPIGRALASVVEVMIDDAAGSGTLLSKDGWILTNAHVVVDVGGSTARDVVVALTIDPRNPAIEMFRAEVREIDTQRDLALLHVTHGFFGQDLPPDLALPFVECAADEKVEIGDALTLVGYPATGGLGSRVTISATRGIVSGFDTAEFGTLLKTDAEITSGNSGGAALDARGRLIGVPTSTVENGSGQIGFVHPLSAMPPAWRELVSGAAEHK